MIYKKELAKKSFLKTQETLGRIGILDRASDRYVTRDGAENVEALRIHDQIGDCGRYHQGRLDVQDVPSRTKYLRDCQAVH